MAGMGLESQMLVIGSPFFAKNGVLLKQNDHFPNTIKSCFENIKNEHLNMLCSVETERPVARSLGGITAARNLPEGLLRLKNPAFLRKNLPGGLLRLENQAFL